MNPDPVKTIAVFVAPSWGDNGKLIAWVKRLEPHTIVFVTDEHHSGIDTIVRQCRCERLTCAVFRLPWRPTRQEDWVAARWTRDCAMTERADLIVDFGNCGDVDRFPAPPRAVRFVESDL